MANKATVTANAPDQPSDLGLRGQGDLSSVSDIGELAGAQLPETEEAVAVEASNATVRNSKQQFESSDAHAEPLKQQQSQEAQSQKQAPAATPSASKAPKEVPNGTSTQAPGRTKGETQSELPKRTAALTLSSSTDGLVLYDLTNKKGGSALFSPHTTKTILDLKLLGVGYDRQRRSFVQIRTELAQRVAENVTVPTLELSDGTHLSESWKIAEFLETNHPDGHKIFGSTSGKALAAFVNQFGKSVLAPSLGSLAIPGIAKILDEENLAYFEVKIGQPRYDRLCNLSSSERDAFVQQAINHLAVVEVALAAEPSALDKSAKKNSPWLAKGEEPTHADFVLFGWYVYSRAAGKSLTRQIWESAPHLKRWKNALLEWCGPEITDDLFDA